MQVSDRERELVSRQKTLVVNHLHGKKGRERSWNGLHDGGRPKVGRCDRGGCLGRCWALVRVATMNTQSSGRNGPNNTRSGWLPYPAVFIGPG